MAVEIRKPDTHRRTYSYLELDNGLKAIIGSDEACDKAGAALCVNVGMCHERKDLPGLAHFLEHMLFTGTTAYPSEGEYHEFIQQNGGMANAYTTCYMTNYMFEVKPEALEPALDRFSRFFYEPLLTRSCTDREINAVDSEYQAGHTLPWWRYIGIMHMSANPEHPFHVAVGNLKMLRDDPKERGIDLYDEMKLLYDSCYSANGMTICVIGKESISDMEAMVRAKFGSIVNKGTTMPIGDAVSDKPPFLRHDWNRLLLQSPVKDVKELAFSWVIPYQGFNWKSKPSAYISHLLGYEGAGSVISVLKQRGLISACSTANGGWLQGAFTLMNVEIDLTDKGLDHIKEIGEVLFAFLGMLQKIPIERWIFDEMRNLKEIQFKFREDQRPFALAASTASSLQTHPASEALAGSVLLYDYDSEAISRILSMLTLDSMRVQHSSKSLAERCTERDTSYDSPIKFEAIDPEWLSAWTTALSPGNGSAEDAVAAAAVQGLHLPKPNPFIPEDLSLRELPEKQPALPVRLDVNEKVAAVFHRQDDVFRQPKAHVTFLIRAPFMSKDAESMMKAELWCRAVEEDLSEYSYDADIAGARYSLGLAAGGISLTVAGFGDKLCVLLTTVTERMRSMTSVPENVYGIICDAYGDQLRNAAFRQRPISQCSTRFSELLVRGSSFPAEDRYKAFQGLNRSGLDGVCEQMFDHCHAEMLVLGNMTPKDAGKVATAFTQGLRLGSRLEILPERSEAALPPGPTLWSLPSADIDDPNHAVRLSIQLPESMEGDCLMYLLANVLSPKFFDILRTQQQLGYIVQLGASPSLKFTYLNAMVQTEFAPDYVRGRIDAFLDEHFIMVEEKLTEEEFQTCRAGLLSELKTKPKNLGEEMGHYSRAFTNRSYDFARRGRMIEYLDKGVTLDILRSYVREQVRTASRLYIQVTKVLEKEDKALPEGATVPADSSDLRKWAGRSPTVSEFAASAAWSPLLGSPV